MVTSWLYLEILAIVMAGIGGGYVGLWIHEGTHYSLGDCLNAEPRMLFLWKVVPQTVIYDCPCNLSDNQLRLAGGATVVWPSAFLTTVLIAQSPYSWTERILFFTFVGASIVSPSDFLALIFPQRWRSLNSQEGEVSHLETLYCLFGEMRAVLGTSSQ